MRRHLLCVVAVQLVSFSVAWSQTQYRHDLASSAISVESLQGDLKKIKLSAATTVDSLDPAGLQAPGLAFQVRISVWRNGQELVSQIQNHTMFVWVACPNDCSIYSGGQGCAGCEQQIGPKVFTGVCRAWTYCGRDTSTNPPTDKFLCSNCDINAEFTAFLEILFQANDEVRAQMTPIGWLELNPQNNLQVLTIQ